MSGTYVFRQDVNIGNLDAESDQFFLDHCFVTTPMYETLLNYDEKDPNSLKRVIVGRTGSGKTALLKKLSSDNKIKDSAFVEAESTVFEHLKNNIFISNLAQQGVDLRAFYKSLWVHVLLVKTIELLYPNRDSVRIADFFTNWFSDPKKRQATQLAKEYIESYESNFFNEKVLTEITEKMQSEVTSSLSSKNIGINAKLSDEELKKIQRETSQYVSKELLKKQKELISLLAEHAPPEGQKKILIGIDDLDKSWLSSSQVKYDFINALLDAFKDLMCVRSVKIIISIRTDILNGVYLNNLRQDEKDKSLILPIEWSETDIKSVLNKRIEYLIKDQYVKKRVPNFHDLFDFSVKGETAESYILRRSMLRPRDAIDFVNLCFQKSNGKTQVTEDAVLEAEESFYASRKSALCKEWLALFPHIEAYIDSISFVPEIVFNKNVFQKNDCGDRIQKRIIDGLSSEERISTSISDGSFDELLQVWFTVGIIGIKKTDTLNVYSCYEKQKLDITDIDSNFVIHPLFWRKNK